MDHTANTETYSLMHHPANAEIIRAKKFSKIIIIIINNDTKLVLKKNNDTHVNNDQILP